VSRTSQRAYRRNRARVLRQSDICHWCGCWLNPELRFPHPKSATADHLKPIRDGGHNNGALVPACLECNQARNRKTWRQPEVKHARQW
jgi:5-methylcytosine-specific restriction endonuclease McrA